MNDSTKRSIIAISAASIMTITLTGCNSLEVPASGSNIGKPSMTEIECDFQYRIYVHNPTGVHYIVYRSGSGNSAFTIMLNADGTPYTGTGVADNG